jgi:hypothetical protein
LLAAAAAAAALAAQPASAAQVYAGQPSGDSPFQFVLTLSSSGKAVSALTFHFDVACGTDFRSVDFGSAIPIDDMPETLISGRHYLVGAKVARKKLSGTFVGFDRVGETTLERMSATMTGTVKPGSARGRVAVEFIRIDTETGATVAQCAKNLPWKALRNPGVVYGGKTSQDEPVVVELTRDRKRVSHAHLGWWANCQDGSGWTEAHDEFDLQPFKLTPSGAFSKVFSFDFGGGSSEVERFAGKVGVKKASGTFQANVTIAGESLTNTCETGKVSWKAVTG